MNALVEELFHQLADLPSADRRAYFARHAVDDDTRREVESLLALDRGASDFLVGDIAVAARRTLSALDVPGRLCGPYRVLEVIGRGGMGAVYLAERVDGEVRQRVAVKLLPPGAGAMQRERFLQERQILATISHPNIARLVDAGHLDHGQPFLVMDYVDGKPIDAFAAGLDVRQKVALLLKVCAPVAHLHRELIVHRDLKPANVLVTVDGEPKLLDFGIAKLLDLADSTMTATRMLTPAYASPEQMTGGKLGTATDIYSLGALSYRLITGQATHDFADESFSSVASAVTMRDATRPSRWAPESKGDLDAILLKALRRNPQERYETVEQFAADLQAFLDRRPVRARSGSAWYRAHKVARRYWVPFAAAAAVMASLAAGLYVANRERALAQRRFADVRQLATKLFDIDGQVRQLPGATSARQLIVDTALTYLNSLAADAATDMNLALDVGTAYMRVARVQGVPISTNLGQGELADQTLRRGEALVAAVLRAEPSNRTAMLRRGQIAHDRMILAGLRRPQSDALPLAREAARWLDRYLDRGPVEASEVQQVAIVANNVGNRFRIERQFDEAIRLTERGLAAVQASGNADMLLQRGSLLIGLSRIHRDVGALTEALAEIEEAVRIEAPGVDAPPHVRLIAYTTALNAEAAILADDVGPSLGRRAESIALRRRAFALLDDLVHADPLDADSRSRLSSTGRPLADLLRVADPVEAVTVYDHVLRHLAENAKNSQFRRYEVRACVGASYALRRLGRRAEAARRLDRAMEVLSTAKLYPTPTIEAGSEVAVTLQAFADQLADEGRVDEAIARYEDLLRRLLAGDMSADTRLDDAAELSSLYRPLAALERRRGHFDRAAEIDARRDDLWRRWDRALPDNPYVHLQLEELRAGPPNVANADAARAPTSR